MDTPDETISRAMPPQRGETAPKMASQGWRFQAHKPIDPAKVEGHGYGSLLLYYREAVFDKIHRSERLDEMIRFYAIRSLIFGAIFGISLGFYTLNLQIILSAIKLPLLLWGALLICLP